MNDESLALAVAGLIQAQGIALGLLTMAIAEQLDAAALADTLARRATAGKNQPAFSPAVADLLGHAQRAAEAVAQKRAKDSH